MARHQPEKRRKGKPIPAPSEKSGGKEKKYQIAKKTLTYWSFLVGILFAGIVYGYLLSDQSVFLYRSQELSLFLPTSEFFQQQMVVPGGFSIWLGAWFTQFFYYPEWGILLLTGLWLLIYGISLKVFRVPSQWALLGLIEPLALMATITNLGYWVFHLKSLGYMFSNTLGFLGALLFLWIYRILPSRLKIGGIVITVALGYPVIGAYALMAGIYMILLAVKTEKKNFQRILQPVITLVLVGITPVIWYYIYTQINFKYIYLAGLPTFISPSLDFNQWIPFIVLFLSGLPLLLVGNIGKEAPQHTAINGHFGKKQLLFYGVAQLALLIIYVGVAKSFWYNDRNFRAELDMDQAAKNENWEAIIHRAYQEQGEPTRMMVMLKNLALLRQGRGGDEMFRFPDGGARPNAKFEQRMMQAGGKIVYLNYAKLNFCYRWCLEDAVEYGLKAEYLKYMAQAAVFSGDHQVARKYLRTLKQTMFHADWAKEMERFLEDPALLQQDPLYNHVMSLYDYPNRLDGDQNLIEIYLLNYFANTWSGEPMYQEASLMSTLIIKDIALFWPRFFSYVQTHQRIPVHYQEAAVLYSYLEQEHPVETLPVDPEIVERFRGFQNLIAQNPGRSEESLQPLFKSRFGDTFWYFYFFVRNVKSN